MGISTIALGIIETLLNERRECYLREIARKTKKSTSSISRQLKVLKKHNILIERKAGKELMYRLNTKSRSALKLCELVEVRRTEAFLTRNPEMAIILEDFLEQARNRDPATIIVFGSVAKENYTRESDIDILIIITRKEDFAEETKTILAEYGRKISVVNLEKNGLKQKLSEELIKEVIKKHLVLSGYEYFIQAVMLGCAEQERLSLTHSSGE